MMVACGESIEERNLTSVTEFILLGFTNDPMLQILLFILFLIFYIVTLVGNIGMITLIISQTRLHTPMYFFISNLSLSDFFYSSVTTPKMMQDLLSMKKSILYVLCEVQAFFFAMFGSMEIYLLSAMAYDRYAAICHPLIYPIIMKSSTCIMLAAVACLSGIITSTTVIICTFSGSFCGCNVIDHFFCDILPLMKVFISDRIAKEYVIFAVAFMFSIMCLSVTVTSYGYIISSVLKISSTAGRQKAFSTCGSHFTAMSLYYGTALFMYLRPPDSGSAAQDKVVSVCYAIMIPMLNPLIYSVRNQEVKMAIRKVLQKNRFYH